MPSLELTFQSEMAQTSPFGDSLVSTDLSTMKFLTLLLFLTTSVSMAMPVCDSASSDTDGDGWGWENSQSCVVVALSSDDANDANVGCDYSDADQHGGWGWNAETASSCPPIDGQNTTVAQAPSINSGCDYSDATNNSGWGWNASTSTSCPPLADGTNTGNGESGTPIEQVALVPPEPVPARQPAPAPQPEPAPAPQPEPEPEFEPVAQPAPPSAGGSDNILVALHFDVAPDLDDLHAMAAGCNITRRFNRNPAVVIGTYGLANVGDDLAAAYLSETNTRGQGTNDGRTRRQRANEVAALAYNTYLDTGNGWTNAVNTQAAKWWSVLSTGGSIQVADGGPMDFTADVLNQLRNAHAATAAQLKRVRVVQHSAGFNVQQTTADNFREVQLLADYQLIPNGNVTGNGTAGFMPPNLGGTTTGSFANWARNGNVCSAAWIAALNSFSARIDFSDTVEYLSIIGSETQSITDVNSFVDFF